MRAAPDVVHLNVFHLWLTSGGQSFGMRLLLCWILLGSAAQAINLQAPLVPDPVRTPGDVLTSDPKIVCVSGYTKTVRNVPQALKE